VKCCEFTSGMFKHNITVQRQTYVPDGAGGGVNTWAAYKTIRAFIKPVSGSERLYSMRLEANVTHRIFIRYRSDITTTDHIMYRGRLMQIRALINLEEANRFIEIYADEGVAT